MKNLFYLIFTTAVLLFSLGCNKDDDDNGGGTGGGNDDLEVTLDWEAAGTDLDLALVDPNNGVIGGGFNIGTAATSLPDDIDGPGTEMVTFDNNAPDGTYIVTVSIIDVDVTVPFTLVIESKSSSRTFSEDLLDDSSINDDGEFVVTFQKNGSNLTF